ncbi:MAG: glycosyltransferase [Fibrobacter sp.]|nr:glycosyltransferase [Fibrobacter sp.]
MLVERRIVIRLKCLKQANGKNVLVSYLISPFLWRLKEDNRFHTNIWECKEIVTLLLNSGFNVDVIHFRNTSFKPRKKYFAIIDIHSNLERLAKFVTADCIKVLHATGSFWLFQNYQEHLRLYNLYVRKEIALTPMRTVQMSGAKEICDIATIIGNDTTVRTFGHMSKKFVKIPASELIEYNWDGSKDFEKCRKNFLWLGSVGFVHKGLDLVIEAFCKLHEYHLDICGPIHLEHEFKDAFYKELYESENIKTWGHVDVSSDTFRKIINETIGIVYPSCSEGTAGSVIVGMHAGLIPIVSKESGVDITENSGIVLSDCSVEEICIKVREIASMNNAQLKKMSHLTWKSARERYTKKCFSEKYAEFIRNNLIC